MCSLDVSIALMLLHLRIIRYYTLLGKTLVLIPSFQNERRNFFFNKQSKQTPCNDVIKAINTPVNNK